MIEEILYHVRRFGSWWAQDYIERRAAEDALTDSLSFEERIKVLEGEKLALEEETYRLYDVISDLEADMIVLKKRCESLEAEVNDLTETPVATVFE
jgi:predicted nuclease with TOPRIM domain